MGNGGPGPYNYPVYDDRPLFRRTTHFLRQNALALLLLGGLSGLGAVNYRDTAEVKQAGAQQTQALTARVEAQAKAIEGLEKRVEEGHGKDEEKREYEEAFDHLRHAFQELLLQLQEGDLPCNLDEGFYPVLIRRAEVVAATTHEPKRTQLRASLAKYRLLFHGFVAKGCPDDGRDFLQAMTVRLERQFPRRANAVGADDSVGSALPAGGPFPAPAAYFEQNMKAWKERKKKP